MLIVRVLVILFAVLLAGIAAGLVVTLAVLLPAWSDLMLGQMDEGVVGIALAFGALFLSGGALLPSLLVVALAEILAVRSVLFYATAGGLAGVAVYAGLGHFDAGTWQFTGLSRRELEIMAAAGIVAGCVYWVLAGRNAGRWRKRPATAPARTPET